MGRLDLLKGDCLELLKTVPDGSVDLVIADLPYGITHAKWDKKIPLKPLWAELMRVAKPNAAFLFFGVSKFSIELAYSNFKYYRYRWVWEKSSPIGFLNAKKIPLRNTEDILVFYKKLPIYNPQMRQGKSHKRGNIWKGGNVYRLSERCIGIGESTDKFFPTEILKFKTDRISGHGTVKPIPLLRYLIRTYSNEGDTVLDPTMGTGSTGLAAKIENRNFIGFELDEKFFNIAKERIEKGEYKEPKEKKENPKQLSLGI